MLLEYKGSIINTDYIRTVFIGATGGVTPALYVKYIDNTVVLIEDCGETREEVEISKAKFISLLKEKGVLINIDS